MNVPILRRGFGRIKVVRSTWDRAHKYSIRATLVSGRGASIISMCLPKSKCKYQGAEIPSTSSWLLAFEQYRNPRSEKKMARLKDTEAGCVHCKEGSLAL
eukprot:1138649-Pelagomonas_calceolata.AAC.1